MAQQHSSKLVDALGKLDERSRTILQERWLSDDKSTLRELAARFDISAERIRQLEKTAIKKLPEPMIA